MDILLLFLVFVLLLISGFNTVILMLIGNFLTRRFIDETDEENEIEVKNQT